MKKTTTRKIGKKNGFSKLVKAAASLNRGLVVLILAVVIGGGYYGYAALHPDKVIAAANLHAEQFMRSLKDCDYKAYQTAKFGIAFSDGTDNSDPNKLKFLDGCKQLKDYRHLQTARQTVSKEQLAQYQKQFPGGNPSVYLIDYKLEATNSSDAVVSRLVVMGDGNEWIILPAPGFPITELQYQKIKNK